MTHVFECRVYYEDTDLAGIVYYANYLKFIERARSEYLRDLGVDQVALRAGAGLVFAVRRIAADFLVPARFDDLLSLTTTAHSVTGARIELRQEIRGGETAIFAANVTIVALKTNGRPTRIPADVRRLMTGGSG